MKFSLVMCTLGRSEEIAGFFESLNRQSRSDLEIIIVDQNVDDRVVPIVDRYSDRFEVKHVRTDSKGASRARNIGFDLARGEIVCFPDDDCEYPAGYLDAVESAFDCDAALGALSGFLTADPAFKMRADWERDATLITKLSVPNQSQEFTICVRRADASSLRFNPLLGVGSGTPWGSDEGPDFLLRLINAGVQAKFFPNLVVYHPDKVGRLTEAMITRAASYARGRGCFLRLHQYPLRVMARTIYRPMIGSCLYLLLLQPKRARYYAAVVRGLMKGYRMNRAEIARVAQKPATSQSSFRLAGLNANA